MAEVGGAVFFRKRKTFSPLKDVEVQREQAMEAEARGPLSKGDQLVTLSNTVPFELANGWHGQLRGQDIPQKYG